RKKRLRIPVRGANRVRYTVPQYFDSLDHEKAAIMFRVTDVYPDVQIVISSGTERICSAKRRIVRPGEMQVIELSRSQLEKVRDSVTVSIELPEEDID
ncbi:MAG: pyridine nucleotide-disulfide oxidoreductase, partial [Spirochaetaceae bacterium]|nr:pyridine nucleotide-disulfide oxidoreductase [Spirochaetaceae bacterium]